MERGQTLTWGDVARIDDDRLCWEMGNLDRAALMVLLARALDCVPGDPAGGGHQHGPID